MRSTNGGRESERDGPDGFDDAHVIKSGGPRKRTRGLRRKVAVAAAALAVGLPVLSACGSDYSAGTLHLYPPADGADSIAEKERKMKS